jgi:CheY-like chemotaxis protein
VLSDLSLPDGEGHELVATLRARLGATPPVVYIAVSGHDRVSALARVFDRLLQKPVRLPALVQAIEDVEAALAGAATSG